MIRLFQRKQPSPQTGHRAAWEQREGDDIGGVASSLPSMGVAPSYVSKERWRNEQEYNLERPSIGEIVEACISETSDTHEKVITLRAVDGRKVSLWLVGQRVQGITNY